MTDIETVRLLIGDRKKAVVRELVTANNDGVELIFQLNMYPLASGAADGAGTGNVRMWSSGVEVTETATTTWSGALGRCTLASALTAGEKLEASYSYYTLTSGELSDILSGHTGYPLLAASHAALVLAGDTSRYFAYTMGEKIVDKRQISKNFLALSEKLEKRHYAALKDSSYTATVMTFKDDTGTPYEGYDTAVAYLTGTS